MMQVSSDRNTGEINHNSSHLDNLISFYKFVQVHLGRNNIITKGIFYSYDENKIIIFLIIDDEKIYDNTNLLFQGIIATQEFYGYKVNVIEKNKCITTAFYTNKGKNVTDGPIFLWNTQKQSFSKYEVDRSQW